MSTVHVQNVARRPVDVEGGRVLAHGERAQAPDTPHTRALIAAGHLAVVQAAARTTRGGGDA